MGRSFSVSLAKVVSKNSKKFRIIKARRYAYKKSIPRRRNSTLMRYTIRRDKSKLEVS